jgi:hypothetical protein
LGKELALLVHAWYGLMAVSTSIDEILETLGIGNASMILDGICASLIRVAWFILAPKICRPFSPRQARWASIRKLSSCINLLDKASDGFPINAV